MGIFIFEVQNGESGAVEFTKISNCRVGSGHIAIYERPFFLTFLH